MALTVRTLTKLSLHFGKLSLPLTKPLPTVRYYKRWVAPTLHELQRRKDSLPIEKPSPRSSFLEWNYDAELFAFGKRLSEDFKTDLLKQSLTHKSYVFQQQKMHPDATFDDNSQMVTDGEILLNNFVQSQLNKKYPPIISEAVSHYLTNDDKLAFIAKHIGLTDLILTEEFPVDKSTLSNTFKALLAALTESSGLDRTHKFIDDFVFTQLNGLDVFDIWEPHEPYNYLKALMPGAQIEPRICNQSASSTILANYQIGLYSADKKLLGIGWGESIDNAKDTAALDAIRKIYQIQS